MHFDKLVSSKCFRNGRFVWEQKNFIQFWFLTIENYSKTYIMKKKKQPLSFLKIWRGVNFRFWEHLMFPSEKKYIYRYLNFELLSSSVEIIPVLPKM